MATAASMIVRDLAAPAGPQAAHVEIRFVEQRGQRAAVVECPSRPPRAQAMLVHGLTEHCGRPLGLARSLAERGFRVIVPELLAHGAPAGTADSAAWIYDAYARAGSTAELLSEIRRRENARGLAELRALQYRRLRNADARLQADQIQAALALALEGRPELPMLLVGHSMGGLLSLEAAWRWSEAPQGDLQGVVLLSPALRPTPPSGKLFETVVFESVWRRRNAMFSPTRAAVKGLLGLNLPVDTTSGNRWVSDLPEEVELYGSDPLIPARLPTRYVSSIETQMSATDARGPRLPVPGLVVVPEVDGITSAEAGTEYARSVQQAMGADHLELVTLSGLCAHDVMRSTRRERALAALDDWLGRQFELDVAPAA